MGARGRAGQLGCPLPHLWRHSAQKKSKPGPFPVRGSACPAIKLIIGSAHAEVNITFEEPACPKAPRQLPLPNQGCCGPDGIRTRTFQLDRLMCSHYTTGPSAGYGLVPAATRLCITPIPRGFRSGTKTYQFRSVFPVFSVY